ncbi:TM2 domain-containing protein [Amylibacter sp. IMCC11727]|uniref:TM2 domain-containing protein n=1 Tax=Amylibacter sp. IMCC11727 TaxID=3039851 RepID=UPI00244E357B|nr:TM2 domain-containing protein [Amylibacter sp. IMCC11727]WGI20236.1 TM2 domain-containing protein [Amylibacter sp. IMCC11727]
MQKMRTEKSMVIAYVIWFFLGQFGVHRMYLGRVRSGLLMLGLIVGFGIFLLIGLSQDAGTLSDTGLMIMSVSSFSMLALWFCWYIVDIVLIAVMVSKDNNEARKTNPDHMEQVFK